MLSYWAITRIAIIESRRHLTDVVEIDDNIGGKFVCPGISELDEDCVIE